MTVAPALCKKLLMLADEFKPMKAVVSDTPNVVIKTVSVRETEYRKYGSKEYRRNDVKAIILLNDVEVGEIEYYAIFTKRSIADLDEEYVKRKLDMWRTEIETTQPLCFKTSATISRRCGWYIGRLSAMILYAKTEDIEFIESLVGDAEYNNDDTIWYA